MRTESESFMVTLGLGSFRSVAGGEELDGVGNDEAVGIFVGDGDASAATLCEAKPAERAVAAGFGGHALVDKDLLETAPADWSDLSKSEYSGAVALTGDPRSSAQAILALMSAGISRGAKPGTESGGKGLELFAELNKSGNFVPVLGKAGTIALSRIGPVPPGCPP